MITETHETFGPQEAESAIDSARAPDGSLKNRRIDPRRVSNLARQMHEGRYFQEIPTIAFNEAKVLVGGFHTLHAIIRSGTTWQFRTLHGVPEVAVPSFGEQRAGTAVDELRRRGHTNYTVKAAITNAIMNFEQGRPTMFTGKFYTAAEIADRAENIPLMETAVRYAQALYSSMLHVNRPASGVAFLLLHDYLGEEAAVNFFDKVSTGLDIQYHTPELALRSFLEREYLRGKKPTSTGRQFANNRILYGFLRAGRGILQGEEMNVVHVPTRVTADSIRVLISKFPIRVG